MEVVDAAETICRATHRFCGALCFDFRCLFDGHDSILSFFATMTRTLSSFVVFWAILWVLPGCVRAEFILDDFDDSAEVVSPKMENSDIVTDNVGELHAQRILRIAALQADPIARIDANMSSPSQLTIEMTDLAAIGSLPQVAAQFRYDGLADADFTEGGRNDAVLVDFSSVGGPKPPPFLRVLVFDDQPDFSFFSVFSPIPESNDPFTAVLPFDSFIRRDGVPQRVNFQSIRQLNVSIFANGFFGSSVEDGWTVEIDRIRIGRATPEPHSAVYLMFGVCWLLFWKGVRHALSCEVHRSGNTISDRFELRRSCPRCQQ